MKNYIQNLIQSVQKLTVNVGARINEQGFDPALRKDNNIEQGQDNSSSSSEACDIAIEDECKI